MGLRCRIFGHAYDEAETEQEKQRRDEVLVTTFRETEICRRCGHENVVTEYSVTAPLAAAEQTADAATDGPSGDPGPPEDGPVGVATAAGADTGAEAEAQPHDRGASESATRVDDAATRLAAASPTYVCPECQFTEGVYATPTREGDLCPECHRGHITVQHRPA